MIGFAAVRRVAGVVGPPLIGIHPGDFAAHAGILAMPFVALKSRDDIANELSRFGTEFAWG